MTKLRATQTLVSHMAFCWSHPSLVLLEIAWRWLFGIPFLYVLWVQAQQILAQIPPASAGLDRLETQNPWLSSVLLAEAISRYEPSVVAMLHWLVPVGVVGWAIVSGIGRMLVLMRMSAFDPIPGRFPGPSGFRFLASLPQYMALQALWIMALLACFWCWFHAVGWASATYITAVSPPNLEIYLCWLIFISLGIYTVWAMLSWVLAVAPLLMIFEGDHRATAAVRALGRSFSLGKALSGKLMEVGLVLAIVKIMLIVLDMVLSAAPLPFADEFGPEALHVLYVLVAILFLMANDYFHVVRLRSYVDLWRHYRAESNTRLTEFASDTKISRYSNLQEEFASQILDVKGWFVSDESSLWDFTMEDTLDLYYAKIRSVYGVDVSDIEGALLWKILKRIAERV